jgi:hypothetical protein
VGFKPDPFVRGGRKNEFVNIVTNMSLEPLVERTSGTFIQFKPTNAHSFIKFTVIIKTLTQKNSKTPAPTCFGPRQSIIREHIN